jgi:hypothetical protein
MKRKYHIRDTAGVHAYTLIVKEINETKQTKYTLKSSKSDIWAQHFRNTKLITAIDTGNGIVVEALEFQLENVSELDYSSFEYLYLLLDCIKKLDDNISENYTIIENK